MGGEKCCSVVYLLYLSYATEILGGMSFKLLTPSCLLHCGHCVCVFSLREPMAWLLSSSVTLFCLVSFVDKGIL